MKCVILFCTIAAVVAVAQVRLPSFTRKTLPNGVVLQLMERRDVPMATLSVAVRGGAEADPPEKAGLASVTADALRRGTKSRSAGEFSEQLDFIGASWSASVDEQAARITTECLSKDLDRALELLADAVLNPVFPEDEIKKLLEQRIDGVKALKDDPRTLPSRYFREFFYPAGHPYRRQRGGDELTLARIGREDLVRFHRERYVGRNLIVTVVGDIDAEKLAGRLEEIFGAALAGERYGWASDVPPLGHSEPRLLLVDKPGATQSYFVIGRPGIHRTHPDRIPLILVNTLFGGRFTSLLNDELRVNRGLTYGAYSRLEQRRLPGALAIVSYTGTATTKEAIDVALEVLKRFHERGVTEEQLASAKAYVKGRFPTQKLETSGQLASILTALEIFGLDASEIDEYFQRIDQVTVEKANAVVRKYYRPENLQFVVVGDAAKIREQLRGYAKSWKETEASRPGFRAD